MISSITFSITADRGWENMRRWLVGERKRKRLTQAQLAERMGVSRARLGRLERGVSDPYVSTVARWLHALGLNPHWDVTPVEKKG